MIGRNIAAIRPDGALVCGGCLEAMWDGSMPVVEMFEQWTALSADTLGHEAQQTFEAIVGDMHEAYPDMVAIDPRVIAQFEAMPYCQTCGVFLAGFGW